MRNLLLATVLMFGLGGCAVVPMGLATIGLDIVANEGDFINQMLDRVCDAIGGELPRDPVSGDCN